MEIEERARMKVLTLWTLTLQRVRQGNECGSGRIAYQDSRSTAVSKRGEYQKNTAWIGLINQTACRFLTH